MPKTVETLNELFVQHLQDLYDAEKQLVKALPKMIKAASAPKLGDAFSAHLEVTRRQVERLEQAFERLGERPRTHPCQGMRGLIEEGREHLEDGLGDGLLDPAIAGAGKKIEHYEIASYTIARDMAETLGNKQVARLLQQTLAEEVKMEELLTRLSPNILEEAGSSMETEEEE